LHQSLDYATPDEVYFKGVNNRVFVDRDLLLEEVAKRTKQLKEQARRNPLTNLYNQRAMYELFRRELHG